MSDSEPSGTGPGRRSRRAECLEHTAALIATAMTPAVPSDLMAGHTAIDCANPRQQRTKTHHAHKAAVHAALFGIGCHHQIAPTACLSRCSMEEPTPKNKDQGAAETSQYELRPYQDPRRVLDVIWLHGSTLDQFFDNTCGATAVIRTLRCNSKQILATDPRRHRTL